MFNKCKKLFFCFIFLICSASLQADVLFLRENLQKAKPGDFLVTMQNKTLTLFHIHKTEENALFIEEVSIAWPVFQQFKGCTFRNWFENGATRNTSWLMYKIDLRTGFLLKSYVYMPSGWVEKPENHSFLTTLLNLRLVEVPPHERKRIGRVPQGKTLDPSSFWQPQMKIDGQLVKNIPFQAWRTKWPNDKSELSGKTIEIYTPEDSALYPSYLPYWLEITGVIGNAKIRIIDSGRSLNSPHPL
jgi:hypothetical protein